MKIRGMRWAVWVYMAVAAVGAASSKAGAEVIATAEHTTYQVRRGSSNVSPIPQSEEECMRRAREAPAKEGATRTKGANDFTCHRVLHVLATFGPSKPTPACPPRTAQQVDQFERRDCPAGTVGSWQQDQVWSLEPHPRCWVQGAWTPAVPPAGMCAPAEVVCPTPSEQTRDVACPTGSGTWKQTSVTTVGPAPACAVAIKWDPLSPRAGDCLVQPPKAGVTKWVAANGSSSGACTQSAPCTLTRALAIAVAGDEVSVAPGIHTTTCGGQRYIPAFNPTNSGTSVTKQIAFRGGGGTTTELRCSSGAGPVFGAYGKSWIIWDGFYVNEARSPSVSDTGPVVIWSSRFVTVKSSTIAGNPISREDNHTGIRIEQSQDISVDDNTITGIRHTGGASQNFAGVMGYDSVRVEINGNTITDCDVGIFPKGDHGPGLGQWRITGNRIIARRTAIQIGGLKTGSGYGRSLIQDNVMSGSGFVGVSLVSYDGVSPRAIDIHNNTITGFGAAITAMSPGGSQSQVDISIRNNILVGTQVAVNVHWNGSRSSWTEDYNLLWPVAASRGGWYTDGNTRDSLAQWRSATGNGAHSVLVDPKLTSEYKLPAGHPGRTAGSAGLMGAR